MRRMRENRVAAAARRWGGLRAIMGALFLLGATLPLRAQAQGVKVALSPANTAVAPGDTFFLDVTVTRAGSAFNGYQAVFGYDPAVLQFLPTTPLSGQEGSLMTGACGSTFHHFSQGTGTLSVEHSLLCNNVFLTGPGQVYRLRFKALAGLTTTPVRFLPGLQFYNAGVAVGPDSSSDATVAVTLFIAASAGANGSISPSGSIPVTYGGNKSFTITPNVGYQIQDVLVDGVSVGAVTGYTFTNVTAAHTIFASFVLKTYTINASAGAGGSISPSGAVSVGHGANQGFGITPATGFHILDVLVDGVSVGAVSSYTFNNVTAGHSIAASFALNTYTITAGAGANGTISPSGAVPVTHGSNQAFSMTPAAGYHVLDVLVDGVSVGAVTSYTFLSVTGPHTISVSFSINTFTITAGAGANGSISPSGAVPVNSGDSQAFTFTPNTHYHVAGVVIDGSPIGVVSSYTFANVLANHTISVSFALDTYTITATAGANGSISPAGAVLVNFGANKTFTVTPNVGFHVSDLLVDGISAAPVPGYAFGYTFNSVSQGHTIEAVFDAGSPVGVDGDPGKAGPLRVAAFPNPARGAMQLVVRSPREETQRLEIFDLTGRRIRRLESGVFAAGVRRVAWDGRDDSGSRAPSGVYEVLLSSEASRARTRITFIH